MPRQHEIFRRYDSPYELGNIFIVAKIAESSHKRIVKFIFPTTKIYSPAALESKAQTDL